MSRNSGRSNDLLDPREEQRGGDEEEQADREVAQDVLRQAESLSSQTPKSVKAVKLAIRPADDRERLAAPTGRAAGEDDRQDGQHARRDRRDEPGGEADSDQYEHLLTTLETGELTGRYIGRACRFGCRRGGAVAAAGFRRRRRRFG